MNIKELLLFCVNQKASDLHLSSGEPPTVRINGDISKIDLPVLGQESAKKMIYEIMSDDLRVFFEHSMEIDFAFEIDGVARFRVNVFMQSRGISAVFRLIPAKILSLDELNAPEIFKQISAYKNGLILFTGVTGSGKSTSIAAIIDFINENYLQHILTIEDPIEFVHVSKKSLINQRELNTNTHSFTNALKSALREDPDIILIGELRDLETIRLALTAAETGHLVFATLHTSSAAKTIDRIIDVFPASEKDMVRIMLSESLRAVIAQTLVKSSDSSGRVACYEIMLVNSAIKNLIRESKISQINSVIQTSQQYGMQTMDQSLLNAIRVGCVDINDALSYVTNKDLFNSLVKNR